MTVLLRSKPFSYSSWRNLVSNSQLLVFRVLWSHLFRSVVSLFLWQHLSPILFGTSVWSPSRVHFWRIFLHQQSCVMQMPMQIFHRLGFPSHHHPSPMPWTPLSLSLSWLPPCSVFLYYSYQHISFLFTFWYEKWSEVREALWQRNHEMRELRELPVTVTGTCRKKAQKPSRQQNTVSNWPTSSIHYFIQLSYTVWWWGVYNIYFLGYFLPSK